MVTPLTFFAELFPFLIFGFDPVRDDVTKLGINKSMTGLDFELLHFFCGFVYG